MEQPQYKTSEVLTAGAFSFGMAVKIKPFILVLLMLCLVGQEVISQDHKTRNNYTGAWETPASWNPTWALPRTNVNNLDITINGYITVYTNLTLSGASSKLIIDDTLVVIGNLTIDDNNDVQVNNNGILIVRGNLTISEDSKIEAKNYIVVTGNILKLGSTNKGEFSSDDNPVKVFVGGTISPTSLTNNKHNFDAFDCTSPQSTTYTHSDCSYGNLEDIINDPIYPFFESTCSTASLISSDSDNSFCVGTSITFTAGGGISYNFRVNGFSVQDGGLTTFTTTTLTNGAIVDVVVTGTEGCIAQSTGITNIVFNLPVAGSSSNSPVCAGSPLTLVGGPAGMTSYSWTGPDAFTANTQNPTVSLAVTSVMEGIYNLTVTNANGCTSIASTTNVLVNSLPVAASSSNSPVCAGSPLTLIGEPAGMTSYLWTGPDGFSANTQNPTVSLAATVAMAGNYHLTVTDTKSCIGTLTQNVIVNESPIANAGPDQNLEFVFETQMNAELSLYETGEWSLISGSCHINDVYSPTSLITGLSYGEHVLLWKVHNGSCEASAEVKITANDLFVPSVITPNGDGENDYFMIGANVGKVFLAIINRWGNEEYRNDTYKNDWDGRNSRGTELPSDTYFYILKFENGFIKKGSVLIKK